jgi:hypothetical protein
VALPAWKCQAVTPRTPITEYENKPTPVAIARKSAVSLHIVQRTALIALGIVFGDFAKIPHGHQRFSAR